MNLKDQAMIKLNSRIKVIERQIVEQEFEVKELTDKAKGIMKAGDREVYFFFILFKHLLSLV